MAPGACHNLPAWKYKCLVDLKINGTLTSVLVDTGATSSAEELRAAAASSEDVAEAAISVSEAE